MAQAAGLVRTLQVKDHPTALARALAELGHIVKTLHLLEYAGDEAFRRRILGQLNRHERRHRLMSSLFGLYPFLLRLYAESGYQEPIFQQGLRRACRQINVEIVRRSELHRLVVLPKQWIVERAIGWLNRCRRLAKDWECLNQNGLAFLHWASIRLMVRKLCQKTL